MHFEATAPSSDKCYLGVKQAVSGHPSNDTAPCCTKDTSRTDTTQTNTMQQTKLFQLAGNESRDKPQLLYRVQS